MVIAVTGATGFLGSRITRKLVEGGHQVRILRRATSNRSLIADLSLEEVIGDVCDGDAAKKLVQGTDAVIHTAALISFAKRDRKKIFETNAGGTKLLLEACLQEKKPKFLYTSSIAAIGRPCTREILDENFPYNWTPYQISYNESKHEAEKLVLKAGQEGLATVILNPATITGPGDIHGHFGHWLFDLKKGRLPFMLPGGMCMVDVDDVADGHIAALSKGQSGERYILGGENLTYGEITTEIASLLDVKVPPWEIPKTFAKLFANVAEWIATVQKKRPKFTTELGHYVGLYYYFSHEKAARELGFNPMPFRESLLRTYAWYHERNLL